MQTIGERLEEARKRKGISIREAAEATKIRSDYLHKYEANQFDIDLAEIYIRGFLRSYAVFLNLSGDKILNDYAALGRSESRQRQPSREVYGRMDLTVDSPEVNAPDTSTTGETGIDSSEAPQRPSTLNRSGSSLPKGPSIPPTLVFRGGIVLAVIILLLLLYWGINAIIGGSTEAGTEGAQTSSISAEEPTLSLIALNSVRVKVTLKNDDGSPGEVLFPDTTLVSGEVRTIPKPGPILIWATEGKNLQIEINGKRYPMPFEGYNRAQIN
jgi:cytoskeleton protein RodZ